MFPQLQRTIALGTLVAGLLGGCTRSTVSSAEPPDVIAARQTLQHGRQTLQRLEQELARLQQTLDKQEQEKYSTTVLRQPTAEDQHSLDEFLGYSKLTSPGELTLTTLHNEEGDYQCNGFIISRQGHMLTNYHCLNRPTRCWGGLLFSPIGSVQAYHADVLAYNEGIDIALLQAEVDSEKFTFPSSPSFRQMGLGPGEQLTTESIVEREGFIRRKLVDGAVVQPHPPYATETTHFPIVKGQSGSPALDADGRIAGMVKWSFQHFQEKDRKGMSEEGYNPASNAVLVSAEAIGQFLQDYLSFQTSPTTPTTNEYSHTESFIYKCPF